MAKETQDKKERVSMERVQMLLTSISQGNITGAATDRELAAMLSISKATVWRWVREGLLPKPVRISARCSRWKLGDLLKCKVFMDTAIAASA